MRKKAALQALTALLLVLSIDCAAQSAKLARVGFLAGSTAHPSLRTNAFVAGLRDLGYLEGKNLVIDWRPSPGQAERIPEFAADLVRIEVDVIVALDNPSIAAAKKATSRIPIVMVLATDPLGMGFVKSLARPEGNVTGLSNRIGELQGKMLQLVKQALPGAKRVVVLWNPGERNREADAKEAEAAARALGLQPTLIGATRIEDFERSFTLAGGERPDVVLLQPNQVAFFHRARVAAAAAKARVPTIGWATEGAEAGWLMSYGPDIPAMYRRSAYYVDRLLKGAKPADLPIEQPSTFELAINLKTAKTLGVVIPSSLRLRADRVIE